MSPKKSENVPKTYFGDIFELFPPTLEFWGHITWNAITASHQSETVDDLAL